MGEVELIQHATKLRNDLNDELPNGVGNTIDALIEAISTLLKENDGLFCDLDRAMKIANTEVNEVERLREALSAIVDRAPERDIKWAGMNPRDIALHALSPKVSNSAEPAHGSAVDRSSAFP